MSSKINLGVPKFILKMGNPSARSVYEFGDFRLDAGHLMLYCKNEELAIAPKAVETLLALVERRGNIVSKDELLEAVWPNAIVEESNLFVYLSVLRKTLGSQANGDPWVETLRRRGYRFNGDVRLVPIQNGGIGMSDTKSAPLEFVPGTSTSDVALASQNEPHESRVRNRTMRRTIYFAACLVVVAAVIAVTYTYFIARPVGSIAIVPFVNETQNPELEYLSDGITESFITNLSKVPGLAVQSRSSVFHYKGKQMNPRTIGAELGVDAILCGWIKKRGEDLELHVELVDGQSGARMWDATETRRMENLLPLARQIERDLVSELGFTRSSERDISSVYPTNIDAYRLYIKGRSYSLKLTQPEILQGIDYLYKAVAKDPTYAHAYAGIARAHLINAIAGEADPSEFIKAKDAAQKAIALDATLAEAYSALGGVAFFYEWNFTEAERLYKHALALDPRNATAHQQYADFLNKTDRREEGEAEIARARDLEPFSPFIRGAYAVTIRDSDRALEEIRIAIQLDPDHYFPHLMATGIYRQKGMYEEALAELRRAKELSPQQTFSDVGLIGALLRAGKTEEARMIADKMFSEAAIRYIPPPHLALVCKLFGDKDKAFNYLQEGYKVRDPKMVFLKSDPRWDDYRDDARFQDLMRRIGFLN